MEEDGFRSFLGSLGMAHHADRLRAEAVESIDDLGLLDLADIIACGVPAADAHRIEAALAEFRVASVGAAVEESKSSEAAAPPRPPPPGTRPALSDRLADVSLGAPARAKTLAQDELDAAAVHQERLESSLADHRAELRRLRSVLSQREIPDALTCSITLEIMQDPVFATDGHTYERSAIESWLTNNRTSPKTGEPLATTVLFPNHGARQQISDLLEETRRLQAAIDASAEDEKHPS